MMYSPELTAEERELLVELLEAERHNLPVQIRRADLPHVHDVLQNRLRGVERLLDKLLHHAAAAE